MIGYRRIIQQRIYNLKTRKIYVLAFIQFDEGFSYYNISYKAENKDDNGANLGDLWNEADEKEFDKVIDRK